MPRKSHRQNRTLPKYCRHAPTGQAYVRLRVEGNRKTVYLGPHNSRESLERYDRVVGEWLANQATPQKSDTLKVDELAKRYQSYQEPLQNNGRCHHLAAMVRLLSELFGTRPAAEFDAMLADHFKGELVRRGYSCKYGNELLRWLKRMFRWSAQRKLVPTENWTLIESVEPLTTREAPTRDVRPVEDETVERTLPALSATMADMIRFIRLTGCRPGEARLMRVGDVDRENWIWELRRHKTQHHGRARFVVIPPAARELLLQYLLGPDEAYVFTAAGDGKRPYEKRALGRAVDRAIKRINRDRGPDEPELQHWHPYQLRHARAVEVREQFGAEVAQVVLGHTKIDMTQHYARLTKEKAVELARLLG